MQANYKVTYKKDDKESRYILMNSFGLKERLTKKQLKLKKLSVSSFLQISYFQMSVKEDQIGSANIGGLNALVFDEKNQERRSWKFLILGYHVPKSSILLKF